MLRKQIQFQTKTWRASDTWRLLRAMTRASSWRTLAMLYRTGGWRACRFRLRQMFALPDRPGWNEYAPGAAGVTKPCDSPREKDGRDQNDARDVAGVMTPCDSPRIVLYTAIFGDYDELRLSARVPGVDVVVFTEQPEALAAELPEWVHVRYVDAAEGPVLAARQCKILAHRWLADYDYSIWIDGNLTLSCDPRWLIANALASADLASFAHPERDCTYQEAEWVKHLHLDTAEVIDAQMKQYRNERLPERRGLLETALVVRRHAAATAQFNELWWDQVRAHSHRDQLSAMFAIWKTGLAHAVLPGAREKSPLIAYRPHR